MDLMGKALALLAQELDESDREGFRGRLRAGEPREEVLRAMALKVEQVRPELRFGLPAGWGFDKTKVGGDSQ